MTNNDEFDTIRYSTTISTNGLTGGDEYITANYLWTDEAAKISDIQWGRYARENIWKMVENTEEQQRIDDGWDPDSN